MAEETTTQVQVRLVLERQCRELVEHLKPKVPAGVGFLLFLADFGPKGNLAYVSTVDRDDAIQLVTDWLDRQDMNADAASLRMLLESAGHLLMTISDAVGFKHPEDDMDPVALVDWCKGLRARAAKLTEAEQRIEYLEKELAAAHKLCEQDTEDLLDAGKANLSLSKRIRELESLLEQRGITEAS